MRDRFPPVRGLALQRLVEQGRCPPCRIEAAAVAQRSASAANPRPAARCAWQCSKAGHAMSLHHQVRNQTMDLVATLTPEDQMVQSMPDASPAKWHLAHTTWFFETFVLAPHVTGYLPYDERYGFLFNSYYKRLGHHPSRTTRGTFSRPTLDEVWSYRTHVDNIIRDLLEQGASPEVFRLLELGLNHEQQHQELIITDIKHAFWVNPVRPSYQPDQSGTPVDVEAASMPLLAWFCFDGGLHHIGHDGSGFAFDNELPRHTVFIEPFCYGLPPLVTNQEYLGFIADGGTNTRDLWLSDAWDQVCRNSWAAPLEGRDIDGPNSLARAHTIEASRTYRSISFYRKTDASPLNGPRIPTEFEWEMAAELAQEVQSGTELLGEPGDHPRAARGKQVCSRFFGDAWEWTSSPYTAYPGYRPPAGAEGKSQWEIHV